jgi:VanZ family protein
MSEDEKAAARRRIRFAWLPAVAYMALIWTLSSMPLQLRLESIPFRDKGAHAFEYGVLALLIAHAIRRTWLSTPLWRVLVYAIVATFVWGFLDEVHQAFVPGRNSDAADLLADTIGACVGSACLGVFERVRGGGVARRAGLR